MLGLPGVTPLALLENLFPPTPSEFLYPGGRYLRWRVRHVGRDRRELKSLAGSLAYYTLGYRLGGERVRQVIVRFGQVRLAVFGYK